MLKPTTEYVTSKQWESYAKRLERKNLKENGRSLTFIGIASGANGHIVEIQSDNGLMIVSSGWRESMKKAANQ